MSAFRSRYDDIDVHQLYLRQTAPAAWPAGTLPTLTRDEAIRAAKRLWRQAVGLSWPGEWVAGIGNHRTRRRGNRFVVNPRGGWPELIHDLSHSAYRELTAGWRSGGVLRGRTIAMRRGPPAAIVSARKLADYEHVSRRDAAGRRRHHTDAHAALEREMIRTVISSGWLDGRLRPAAKPKAPKKRPEIIRFKL